jgi:protein O-GlcNAc transferase
MLDPRAAIDLQRAGRIAEAENIYRFAVSKDPSDAQAVNLLGMLIHETGRVDEGMRLLRRSIELAPNVPELLSNFGAVLGKSGQADEAIVYLTKSVQLRPRQPQTLYNLGVACEHAGRVDESERAYRAAIALTPKNAEAHNGLGNLLRKVGRLDEAIECHRRAIDLRPDYADAFASLAAACGELGRQADAVSHYRKVVELRPTSPHDHSNLLYTMHYDESIKPEELFEEHLNWGRRHAEPRARTMLTHPNDRDPDRRLRVGYVSADFRDHPVARFQEAVLEHHDHARFEVFCYSDVRRADVITERLRAHANEWREVAGLSDAGLSEMIRRDRIDILVDLAGHAAGNRLPVFARKPAPVQVTCNGYIDTTGMSAMDYRLTDALHDPPGESDDRHTERLIRLPGCNWCYRPDDDGPAPSPAPCEMADHVTFGSLNNFAKVTSSMLKLWGQILAAVPKSRLLLLVHGGDRNNPSLRPRLENHGIPGDRLEVLDRTPDRRSYLDRFGRIDLALDTFPFNGITTTCDALWMGVPVVSLSGRTHVSRAGLSILHSVGRGDLVVTDADQYVRTATALANDAERLRALRISLREGMQYSSLRDEPGYVLATESAYRSMWTGWCSSPL